MDALDISAIIDGSPGEFKVDAFFFAYSLEYVEDRFSFVEGYLCRRKDNSVSGNKLQLIGIKIGKIVQNGGGFY